jgi:TnpA family transposase
MMGVLWTEEALTRRQILTDEERQALLGIPQDADSLARLFTLSRSDRHLVAERLSDASRLGFAVQLALLRHPGTVLANLDQSPEPLVIWLATQLGISAAAFAAYARRPQTMTAALCRHCRGYRPTPPVDRSSTNGSSASRRVCGAARLTVSRCVTSDYTSRL